MYTETRLECMVDGDPVFKLNKFFLNSETVTEGSFVLSFNGLRFIRPKV